MELGDTRKGWLAAMLKQILAARARAREELPASRQTRISNSRATSHGGAFDLDRPPPRLHHGHSSNGSATASLARPAFLPAAVLLLRSAPCPS